MKILVECHHTIGDVVMTFPALNNLRNLYPDAEIQYLGGLEAEIPLISNTGNVSKVHIYNVKEQSLFDLVKLWHQLWREHFDLGIAFGGSGRGLDVLLLKLSGCKRIVSEKNPNAIYKNYTQVDVSAYKHRILREVEVIKAIGGAEEFETTTIEVKDTKAVQLMNEFKILKDARCTIGMVLGTGNFMYRDGRKIIQYNTKKWSEKKFAKLAERLIETGYAVVLFGGEKERNDLKISKTVFHESCIDFVGRLDILTMIAVMKKCRLVVGGDTGPMHCAAAAGVPTLTLFGPTDAELIGPLGGNAEYLYPEYECTKCYSECNEKGRTCKPAKCMDAIRPDDVYRKIIEIVD